MVKKGACKWDVGLFAASEKGHLEIVKYMLKKVLSFPNTGTDTKSVLKSSMERACIFNHREIADYLMENGAIDECKIYESYILHAYMQAIRDCDARS